MKIKARPCPSDIVIDVVKVLFLVFSVIICVYPFWNIIFFKMALPLSKPIVMTIALFVAIGHWNSWFDAYLYTSSQDLKTMQSILVEILNQYQTSEAGASAADRLQQSLTPESIRMAATMVTTIPIIMVYPFIQKYFVKGIMLGSVKS